MSGLRVILIAGPTASGKSALGLALAQRLGGEIINADSMQVYAGLRILTARPGKEQEALAPHHLYGVLESTDICSARRWADMAMAAINNIESRGRLPVVVGGTGLYLKALVEGLSPVPAVPDRVREDVRAEVARDRAAAYRVLGAGDPAWAARIQPGDRQRIARGLEVLRATGKPLSAWHKVPGRPLLEGNLLKVVLAPPREGLRAQIDSRFDTMIRQGALEEVSALLACGYPDDLPLMRALGVRELAAHIRGETGLEEAVVQAKTASRQYAKRQSTWFENQIISWKRCFEQQLERKIDNIFSFIDELGLTL